MSGEGEGRGRGGGDRWDEKKNGLAQECLPPNWVCDAMKLITS